jgi:hypothetical protein
MTAKIVPFGRRGKPPTLPRPEAEEIIHRLAKENKFGFGGPVYETEDGETITDFELKMFEREFTMTQVLRTIEEGAVNQGPVLDEYGDWRCRVKRRVAGHLVRVVVAISSDRTFMTLISIH